ncbi:hypothetical protein [Paraburkholderia sp. 2C]
MERDYAVFGFAAMTDPRKIRKIMSIFLNPVKQRRAAFSAIKATPMMAEVRQRIFRRTELILIHYWRVFDTQKIDRKQLVKSCIAGGSNKGGTYSTMFVNNNNVIPFIMRC